jgi:type I restriction enzyme, S subunit
MEMTSGNESTAPMVIPADWALRRLAEIARIKTGNRNNDDKIDDGAYPFFVRSPTVERINTYSFDCEAILVPGEGNIADILHYIVGRFDVHQRVYAITGFTEEASSKFVYYYMAEHFGRHALANTVKAAVDSLRLPTFERFEVALPATRVEQEAIARALSDADALIDSLRQIIAKKRLVKHGATQELLTGMRRLPGFSVGWHGPPRSHLIPQTEDLHFGLAKRRRQQSPKHATQSRTRSSCIACRSRHT